MMKSDSNGIGNGTPQKSQISLKSNKTSPLDKKSNNKTKPEDKTTNQLVKEQKPNKKKQQPRKNLFGMIIQTSQKADT